MNITIGNGTVSKQLKNRYVATIAGAALALSAIAGLPSSFGANSPTRVTAPGGSVIATRSISVQRPSEVVFVDTEEQKARMEGQMIQEAIEDAETGVRPADRPMIIVRSSILGAGTQPMFLTAADAEDAARSLMQTVEPRSQAVQPMFGTAADAESAASGVQWNLVASKAAAPEADIVASVLSTELAAYGASVAPTGHIVSDADLRASVLSTELASYGAGFQPVQPMFGTAADAEFAAQSLR